MPPRKHVGPAAVTAVDAIQHDDSRVNIPTGELRDFAPPPEGPPPVVRYPRDPSIDPQLVWKGKDEQDSDDLQVPSVPIYVQEKVDPRAIIEGLRRTAERPDDEPEPACSTTSMAWSSTSWSTSTLTEPTGPTG